MTCGAVDFYMISSYLRHHSLPLLFLLSSLGICLVPSTWAADRTARERQEMVEAIVARGRIVDDGSGRTAFSPKVIEALARVPRHEFVSRALASQAYDNRPLPIGHGQTISQPFIVAIMTDLLALNPGQTVLEIGTGSGYQAAILAAMGARVFSIEIIEPLAKEAAERLRRLGIKGVETKVGDGYHGWPERAPFDAIVVTAAAGHVPPPLIRQLKPGGRMVIPVGPSFLTQHLMLVEKRSDGSVLTRQLIPVAFVPLTGKHE